MGNKETTELDHMISARIRERRQLAGLTQKDLAQKIGVTFQQLQKYEAGTNRVPVSRLWSIAQVLDAPITAFFSGVGAKQDEDSPSPLSFKEAVLVRHYRATSPGLQDAVRAFMAEVVRVGA